MKRLLLILSLLSMPAFAGDKIETCSGANCAVKIMPRNGSNAATTQMTVKSGNVGIGTTEPIGALDVRSPATPGVSPLAVGVSDTNSYLRAIGGAVHIGDVNTTKTILQETGGNVGIGTTVTAQSLDIVAAPPTSADTNNGGIRLGAMVSIFVTRTSAGAGTACQSQCQTISSANALCLSAWRGSDGANIACSVSGDSETHSCLCTVY